ncbi:CRISPR system precrRNA processing endoribonuclease RAMP protein Cas6 [Candidatus Parcubacteria bacterium]|nr:MAG: CRISPR system precrRNA processing endoribonuclease RAMP protein Cas6 [Candidatus Parcubacteria bacterium]
MNLSVNIKACRFIFTIVPREPLILPSYKGSTFRGAFGNVFKRIVCATRKNDCSECLLKDKCIYSYVFETLPPSDTRIMRKYKAAPHPFVIEPPLEKRTGYTPEHEINFNLVLIGRAMEYLPYFIYAFEEIGEIGIGKGRGKYSLKTVKALTNDKLPYSIIYDSNSKTIKSFECSPQIISFPDCQVSDNKHLSLTFLTPMRISYNNALTANPEFHILVRNLLRRLSLIAYFHCDVDMTQWDFRGIIEMAKEVRVKQNSLRWFDWERYSARQDTRMKLGGFIGDIIFEGNINPFMSLIRVGELIHVGKGTTFGLGKYEVRG